ncbi:hypothetical protein ACWD25_11915 [Streptomyces sp. NPDC002920]
MPWATSMRKPSTPRSNQKRRIEANSARTSWLSQLRSGCSGAKRWRYHWHGYHGDPQRTAERFRDGELRTGDVGFVHDGEVFFVGRADGPHLGRRAQRVRR